MRNWAVLLLMGTMGCTGCSGGETPPSPDEDVARDGGIWSPDRGEGIEVLERGRSLPPAHLASVDELRADVFESDEELYEFLADLDEFRHQHMA